MAKHIRSDNEPVVREPEPEAPEVRAPGHLSITTLLVDGAVEPPKNISPGKLTRSSLISRKASGGSVDEAADEKLRRAQASSGEPIPDMLRKELEAALGRSVDGVRIHTGSDAAEAAEAVAAHAFATGQDIYFGRDAYDPHSMEGRKLIAHEVAHTVQSPSAASSAARVSSPADSHEREADAFAESFARNATRATVPRPNSAPAALHRYTDAQLADAAANRDSVLIYIDTVTRYPRGRANEELRRISAALQRARRPRGQSLVSVRINGALRRLRYEDVQMLRGRVRHALETVRRGSAPREDDPSGEQTPGGQLTLNERDRENLDQPPSTLMREGSFTEEDVEVVLRQTRAFGDRFRREIAAGLRRNGIEPGQVSERIHYLPTEEFRVRARAYLESLFNEAERSRVQDMIDQQLDGFYGYTDEETHECYVDTGHAENSHRIHEAVHLVQSQRFVEATQDPSNLQRPALSTAFHEAATSYITMVICHQNGFEYFDDYPRELVQIAGRVAARVGNDVFFRAYMTGNIAPIVREIPLFDQLLEGFYRADIERINAAFAGRESANVHPNDTLRPRRRR